MNSAENPEPLAPGRPAPHFTLPAIDGNGPISLSDYRGRSPLFLALLIGLWCPFCRRQIAQIGAIEGKLKGEGIDALGIVATSPENAKLYFRFRPTRLRLAADPELKTHRAYGLPKPAPTPEFMQAYQTIRVNPFGDFPEPLPLAEAVEVVSKADGYTPNERDNADMERQWPQLKGQFLIDRDGIVRWAHIECATEGPAGMGKMPSADEIIAAARMLQ
jgi:peroxiredoxin